MILLFASMLLLLVLALNASADSATYYFNSWNASSWDTTDPIANLVDASITTFTRDNGNGHYIRLNSSTCNGTNLGTINSVELRIYFHNNYDGGTTRTIVPRLIPFFGGSAQGNNHNMPVGNYDATAGYPAWSTWFGITTDTNAPSTWTWNDVKNLDCRLESYRPNSGQQWAYKIELRVNYTQQQQNQTQPGLIMEWLDPDSGETDKQQSDVLEVQNPEQGALGFVYNFFGSIFGMFTK